VWPNIAQGNAASSNKHAKTAVRPRSKTGVQRQKKHGDVVRRIEQEMER
jgi:hypothetical protein